MFSKLSTHQELGLYIDSSRTTPRFIEVSSLVGKLMMWKQQISKFMRTLQSFGWTDKASRVGQILFHILLQFERSSLAIAMDGDVKISISPIL